MYIVKNPNLNHSGPIQKAFIGKQPKALWLIGGSPRTAIDEKSLQKIAKK